MSTTTFNCVALPYGGKRAYRSSVFFSSLTIRKTFSRKLSLIFLPFPCTVPLWRTQVQILLMTSSLPRHTSCPPPNWKWSLSSELQLWPVFSYTRNSENVTPGPAASASPGKLLEMHLLRPSPRHPTEGTRSGPGSLWVYRLSKWCWHTLQFESHCPHSMDHFALQLLACRWRTLNMFSETYLPV